jgi:hypothetical protein
VRHVGEDVVEVLVARACLGHLPLEIRLLLGLTLLGLVALQPPLDFLADEVIEFLRGFLSLRQRLVCRGRGRGRGGALEHFKQLLALALEPVDATLVAARALVLGRWRGGLRGLFTFPVAFLRFAFALLSVLGVRFLR